VATMPPAGPVYLSISLDDWDALVASAPLPRIVSTRVAPDPKQLTSFLQQIRQAGSFALILRQEVDRSFGWEAAVKLAEFLNAPVYQAPL
jgi:benzoylformate decarboxylase